MVKAGSIPALPANCTKQKQNKMLKKIITNLFHLVCGLKVKGKNPFMTGDCSYLTGNCTYLTGNCTGLRGECTGIEGDLDECGIADEQRKNGIDINTLLG
jgi:hypothetical protein